MSEVKRAFRNLSIVLHPDKNAAEDANVQFRNLVSVYEVLKDPSKREKYNKVLRDGLPNWRSAVYYYRRMRKMTLAEGALIVFVLVTISQYLIAWGSYFEKKFTAQHLLGNKIKKQKKNRINVDIDTILNEIPKPSVKNTLPLQIPIGLYNLVVHGPSAIKRLFKEAAEQRRQEQERVQKEKEEAELQQKFEEERAKEKENRILRRRKQAENLPRKTDEELAAYSVSAVSGINSDDTLRNSRRVGGLWTDDDLVELVRLVKKYPGGTTNRWEIIAEMMGRTVSEVTQMAAKLKETAYKVPGQNESPAEQILHSANKKVKTRKPADVQIQAAAESVWSQAQQQALETAITKYPKTGAFDRWEKIADAVPGKNKDECLARYKYLVELVKKQKAAAEAQKEVEEAQKVGQETLQAKKSQDDDDEEKEVDEKQKKSKKKKKGQKGSDGEEDDGYAEHSAPSGGGKAKNKRKERKKNIEYSYDDYEDSSDDDVGDYDD